MLTIDLTGKVVLVTGGSRGIGRAITRTLCAAGADVVFSHTGNPDYQDDVDNLIGSIRGDGGIVEGITLEATDSNETRLAVDRIATSRGRIDALVTNVGRNLARPAESVSDEEWDRLMVVNLGSAFYAVRAVLPHMLLRNYGRIVFVGSSAAYDGGGGAIDYAAAKAGLHGMMHYLVKNYARKGIITNTVDPCVIETDLLKERYSTEEAKQTLISQIPANRLGRPEDIAGMVTYLVSSWGDYICGQSILLDGGRTLGR